jgi:hypothetical protein
MFHLRKCQIVDSLPIERLSTDTSMMSDRSNVMKKTNAIIDDWQTLKLSDLNETEIKKLNCSFRFS